MAIQTAGYEYNGNEAISIIVRPQFIGLLPTGMKPIFTEGAGSIKKTYFSNPGNNLVKYADGFQGGVASGKKQKKFSLGEFKSENTWSKQTYDDLIQRQASDVKDAFQNDIFKNELAERIPFGLLGIDPAIAPTEENLVSMAEYLVQTMGVAQGILEAFYLADTAKVIEKAEGIGTFGNGIAFVAYQEDIRFTAVDGLWKNIISAASTTPSIDQIKRIQIANGAVAQINTITLTGTSGTGTVTVKGVASLATFDTDIATTTANFVAAFAADYLAVGLVLTGTTTLIFTAAIAGVGFDDGTFAAGTGNLGAGSVATDDNTAAADLAADEAKDTLVLMKKNQPRYLKSLPNTMKIILATQSFVENYEDSLGGTTLESQRSVMINGILNLAYHGIPIFAMPIDAAIEAYGFGYPHRAILTVADNLAPILSSANGFAESKLWFENKDNLNMTRTQLEMGADFWLPELMIAAY